MSCRARAGCAISHFTSCGHDLSEDAHEHAARIAHIGAIILPAMDQFGQERT